ncbi:putative nuclease HARBI1 [Ruditapes philippinarum]|uniref:putative nuclease HARBI1 n=1 Tax=Ruditapes philippinarum TaxID=129788 RepID=UPI00295BC9B8|nr:putative nuclease HARBI1 [Ruditapes philippinarum]
MARYLLLLQHLHHQRQRVPRVFRDRQNPLDYTDDDNLVKNYRLDRHLILDLCAEIGQGLERPTRRSQSLQVSLQILIALRYYATGSFQSVIADAHGVKINSVSRSIHYVSRELSLRLSRYVNFPDGRTQQLDDIKDGFHNIAGFPNVLGAVDGTFVPIIAQTEDEHLYVTRKGFHAINMQGICDSQNIFLNVVVCWPGSSHDAFVSNNSETTMLLEENDYSDSWLLGDSAYPLKRYLLTPVLNPTTQGQIRYNIAHKRTRCIIERTFGLWKVRFRCLHKSGGYLMYSPKNVFTSLNQLLFFIIFALGEAFRFPTAMATMMMKMMMMAMKTMMMIMKMTQTRRGTKLMVDKCVTN